MTSLLLLAAALLALPLGPQDPPFGVAASPWPVDGLGHHRAIVRVSEPGAVVAHLPWRRRDANAAVIAVVVVDLATGKRVLDAFVARADRESGDVVFRPATVPGEYALYYLPFRFQTSYGGTNTGYLGREPAADALWGQTQRATWTQLPRASLLRFEARTPFDTFAPMELVATGAETEALLAGAPDVYLVFPESRRYPIRMTRDLPLKWIEAGPSRTFADSARPNEYFALQLGMFAARQDLENLKMEFSPLRTAGGREIPATALTCFNLEGTNWDGTPMHPVVSVPKGRVQALWVGVDVPPGAGGLYEGDLVLRSANAGPTRVHLILNVEGAPLADRGDSELWRHSRLRWLNSQAGVSEDVVPPYTPVTRRGRTLACLGRTLEVGAGGLPEAIRAGGKQLLSAPVRFAVSVAGSPVPMRSVAPAFGAASPAAVSWLGRSAGDAFELECRGRFEFDGHASFTLRLKALRDLAIDDVALELPMATGASTYFMGAGRGGGLCPDAYEWDWKGPWDSFWIGDVHGGVHCELRGGAYHGPLLNLFHPAPPESWGNDGRGRVVVRRGAAGAVVRASSGARVLKDGESVAFEFALLVTPVKPIDTARHFAMRFYHNGAEIAPTPAAIEAGANVVNVHHANAVNPYINYPFVAVEPMRRFVEEQHAAGRKVKIYDTIRELTNYVEEIWALRSLGSEVFAPGAGGGFAWLQEHMAEGYIPSWYHPYVDTGTADASIVTSGFSRWINYYVEGLGWLAGNVGIDGLYLDDVAFDRRVLQRMRRVLSAGGKTPLIDLHSNTGFSIGPANQYAEFFPYVDRLWFGESFQYDAMSPDQWLVECSGIPFGLMGEMLQGGGNRWLGMVYGMSTRFGWTSEQITNNPDPIWKFWDAFGIGGAKMSGYWEPDCPVRTGVEAVKATAYVAKGKTLVAIGNFGAGEASVRLELDLARLGLRRQGLRIVAPAIEGYQEAREFSPTDRIPVAAKRGWLLVVSSPG